MKFLLASVASLSLASSAFAGTAIITVETNASGGLTWTTNSASGQMPKGGLISKAEIALASIVSATNWGFVAYGTYGAHSVKVGNKKSRAIGGGILGIYDFNAFMGIGGGVDEIGGLDKKGELTVISANVQVQVPLQPLLFTGWSWAAHFTVTPFVYSGLGTPLSGTSGGSAVTHEGEGVNIDFVTFSNWSIGGGFAYIERQNAGAYSGNYWNPEVAIHRPF